MNELRTQPERDAVVEIDLRMPRPWTHLFEVSVGAPCSGRVHLDFVMPVWTPGSYLVREFARNVQDFRATDAEGNALPWEKIRKNAWRVRAGAGPVVTAFYRVLAFETSVRSSFLDDSRAFVSASSLVCFVDGLEGSPCRLRIHPPEGWTDITTGLDPLPGEGTTFLAPDYETLVDCPVEIGTHRVLEFAVRDVPHRVALTGEGNFDPEALRRDLQRIVETAVALMGQVPYSRYAFLVNLVSDGNTGLEHGNSCALQVSRWVFRPDESYRRFLSLAAHEHFHAWNGKRLRPAGLGPFDYETETFTRLLWVTEGFTDYYAEHILRRAGLATAEQYLEALSRVISAFLETPGRLVQSAAQASFDAWIKFYRPDPHSPNNSVSYYVKGHLIALVLDLEIRRRTGDRTLDDVMRRLYDRSFRRSDRGFTEEDLREACAEVAGPGLECFIDECANGTAELDLELFLGFAGLRFAREKSDAAETPRSHLGVSLQTIDGRLTIVGVTAASPAYEQGLNVNDEILALDGFRVTQDSLARRISERPPGSRVEMLLARGGRIRTAPLVLGTKDPTDRTIVRVESPTDEQKRFYESWLATPW